MKSLSTFVPCARISGGWGYAWTLWIAVREVLKAFCDLAGWCFVNNTLVVSRSQSESRAAVPVCPAVDRTHRPAVEVIDSLSGYTIRGVLDGFTPGEVQVRIAELLPEQRPVSVRILGFLFFGDVVYCRVKDDAYEAHITIDDFDSNGLRKEPRLPVRVPGQLWMANEAPKSILLRDISGQGLRIESAVAVPVDEALIITTARALVFGTVRYCRNTGDNVYRAGIEIEHVLERSSPQRSAERGLHTHAAKPGSLKIRFLRWLFKLLDWQCDHCGAA